MADGTLEVHIRTARVEDAPGIVAVLNAIIDSGAPVAFNGPLGLDEELRYIADFPERGVFRVAIHARDGSVLGFQSMEPFAESPSAFDHVGVIGTYVALGARRQGVASALFEATFSEASEKGFEKVMAFVRSDNEAGLAMYTARGFRYVGTAQRHARIDGAYIDEAILERLL